MVGKKDRDRQRITAAELYNGMAPEAFYETWGRLWDRMMAGEMEDFTDEEWGIFNRGLLAMHQPPAPDEEAQS
jgi:hypothetical protein